MKNPKSQNPNPNPKQIPNSKFKTGASEFALRTDCGLEFETYLEFEFWDLEFATC